MSTENMVERVAMPSQWPVYGDTRVHKSVWAKVSPPPHPSACWLWRGKKNAAGYGRVNKFGPLHAGNPFEFIHRRLYQDLVSQLDKGVQLDHMCRNTSCCNPAHLDPVSEEENLHRAKIVWRQGRQAHWQYLKSIHPDLEDRISHS